jgi:hypothetical protein
MGWNTGVIILNDAMGQITKHPNEFVENLNEAISLYHRDNACLDIRVGNHGNAASVFHQSHADSVGVYSIGGNCASKMMETQWLQIQEGSGRHFECYHNGGRHTREDDKLGLLKQMADEMGYRLHKKPSTER